MPVIAAAIIGKKVYDAHKRRKKFKAEKAASRKKAREWFEKNTPNRDKLKGKKQTLELKTSKKPNERRYGKRI
jgi:hypothetical protein